MECLFVLAKSSDHTGTQFVVAFFRNLELSTQQDVFLIIAAVGNENTTIDIKYNHNNEDRIYFHHLTPGLAKQISFKKEFGTIKMPFPVVRINSTHPVSITTFVDGSSSAGSYLAFPIEVAGVEYRMLPYCNTTDNGICVCAIVNLYRNTTVSLVNENHGNISIYTVQHTVGENTIDSMSFPHSNRTFRIDEAYSHVSLESPDDFTGLLLVASHPVQVFCGGTKEKATMSMEQIPSVMYFGRSFYTFPITVNDMSPSKLRFISHYNCTKIEISNSDVNLKLNAGQFQQISTREVISSQITSNKPIAIMHIFSGLKPGSRNPYYQEGILFLPSVNSYVSSVVISRRKKKDESMTTMSMYNETFQYRSESCEKQKDIVDKSTTAMDTPVTEIPASQSVNWSTLDGTTPSDTSQMNLKTTSKSSPNPNEYTHSWISEAQDGSTVRALKSETNAVSSESIISQCPKCPCHQESTPKYTVHTEKDLDKRIREIKKELTIKKADLSAYRRMKTSAEDGRISAKGIGFVGETVCEKEFWA
uniref:IgGFc-binding protein N-terminal domain-containing protein n=1 Tax=Magallana gigas TaxID=29159 RepID=K1QAW0_MAGGI